jgi:hypothetical protein
MYTVIEVAHNRLSGPLLRLKRKDGCCLTLDFENEAFILDAKGHIIHNLGVITEAREFLTAAMEFSEKVAVVLQPGSKPMYSVPTPIRTV